MKPLLVTLLIATGAFANADAPGAGDLELDGPATVAPGRSAIFRVARSSVGDEYDWRVEPSHVQWIAGDNRSETFVILLDLEPGRYFVSLASFANKTHATRVVDVSAGPGPEPLPPPSPDDKFGLMNAVRAWIVATVPAEHRGKARELAASFRANAAAIAAGTIRTPEEVLSKTRASNSAALGASVEAWKAWGTRLEKALADLHRQGRLSSVSDYAEAWRAIATGLETQP